MTNVLNCHVYNEPMKMYLFIIIFLVNIILFYFLDVEYDQDMFLTASVRCILSLISSLQLHLY